MKKKFIAKTAYVLMLCLAISSVAFTSSVDVYEQYYQGLFETIDMLYYRDLGFNNIQGTALNGVMENLNEYSCFVLNDNDNPMKIDLEGYDHTSTTEWIRYFNREGLRMMKESIENFIGE